jgi:hypothetical protein
MTTTPNQALQRIAPARHTHPSMTARILLTVLALASAADAQIQKVAAPEAVAQLAEAYLGSLPSEEPLSRERAFVRDDFLRSFFSGFTRPGARMTGGTEAGRRGFAAGQEYWKAHRDKLKETMEGFGYVATEAKGVYTSGFEHSGFRPTDRPNEEWWLSTLGNTESDLAKNSTIRKPRVAVRITGFLSPGRVNGFGYGHMNQYDREFYATKISKLDGG